MSPLVITIGILIFMILGFFSGKLPYSLVSFIAILVLAFTNVLKPAAAFGFLANTNLVLMGSMMVVSAGIGKTGLLMMFANGVKKFGNTERALVTGFCIIIAIMSQITQSAVVYLLLCPIIYKTCEECEVSPSRVLLPVQIVGLIFVGMLPIANGGAAWARYQALLETYECNSMGIWDLVTGRIPGALLVLVYMCVYGYKLAPFTPSMPPEIPETKSLSSTLKPWQETMTYLIFAVVGVGMITSNYTGIQSYLIAAAGAAMMVFLGILNEKETIRAIPWGMLFMIGGALAVASALSETGAGDVVGQWIVTCLGGTTNKYIIGIAFFMVPLVLTQFMSNTGVDNIFSPLVIMGCKQIGINPIPFLSSLRVAGATAFLTPMAAASIPLVMSTGGYKMKDIIKVSVIPMVIVTVSCILCNLNMFEIYL